MVKAFVLMELQSMSYEQLMEPFAAAPLMIVWLSRIIRARAYNWWSRRGFLSITLHYYIFMEETRKHAMQLGDTRIPQAFRLFGVCRLFGDNLMDLPVWTRI